MIETDKLIWFPAKNPAKNSLAVFLFFYFRLILFVFNMSCNYHILVFTNIKYFGSYLNVK
ncbi:hypothetical protein BSR19_02775 [Streptococcus salivarius]|uniref:Uncharacterized protein n=1 Tax=Streptococcus salivarius TaxID=1304 RepID=A0AB37D8W2_STRSL|nr:hypothetical protein BSR19_02775 [Streptococcus salivarius]